jgi:hypothetical protein
MFLLSISPSIVNLGQYQYCTVSSLTLSSDWFSSFWSIILFESSTLDRNKTSSYNSCIGYLEWTFRVMSSGKTVCYNVAMLIVGHLRRIWSELWRTSLIQLLTKEHDSSIWPAIDRWCIHWVEWKFPSIFWKKIDMLSPMRIQGRWVLRSVRALLSTCRCIERAKGRFSNLGAAKRRLCSGVWLVVPVGRCGGLISGVCIWLGK